MKNTLSLRQRILALLAALFLAPVLYASDFDFESGGICCNITSGNTVEVTYGNNKYTGSVTIPESVTYNDTQYSVTAIGDGAFYNCPKLTGITLPNSVTDIGNQAFYGCYGLTEITLPNSVTTIGKEAFFKCYGLKSITVDEGNPCFDSRDNCNAIIRTADNTLIAGCQNTRIPNSVTTIGNGALYWCSKLTGITIPNSVTDIGKEAFYGCSGLTQVTLGTSVTSIGDAAFYNCTKLTQITLPNTVTSIGDGTFGGCSGLTQITIPNSVTDIGKEAFYSCSGLESITVAEGNPCFDSRNNCNAIIRTADNTLIAGCQNSRIPNSVTAIGDGAFSSCNIFTEITIPNAVTSIGDYAFYNCSGLTQITIPNAVTSIGDYAFSWCYDLTQVTLGKSVTAIGDEAFSGCYGLTRINALNPEPPAIYSDTFDSSTRQTATLGVPPGCKQAYQTAEYWKNFLSIEEDLLLGIDTSTTNAPVDGSVTVYTLDGVRLPVTRPEQLNTLAPGLYIVNGQKVRLR